MALTYLPFPKQSEPFLVLNHNSCLPGASGLTAWGSQSFPLWEVRDPGLEGSQTSSNLQICLFLELLSGLKTTQASQTSMTSSSEQPYFRTLRAIFSKQIAEETSPNICHLLNTYLEKTEQMLTKLKWKEYISWRDQIP